MSITHEQLKKNVDVSRERLERSRARRALWVKRHGTQRNLTVGSVIMWTFSSTVMFLIHPIWVFLIFVFLAAACFGVGLEGMVSARKGIKRAQEDTHVRLSDVVDDIQALVDRETLALMNPSAYSEIEYEAKRAVQEKEDEQRRILERRSRGRLTMPKYVSYDRMRSNEWYVKTNGEVWEEVQVW